MTIKTFYETIFKLIVAAFLAVKLLKAHKGETLLLVFIEKFFPFLPNEKKFSRENE